MALTDAQLNDIRRRQATGFTLLTGFQRWLTDTLADRDILLIEVDSLRRLAAIVPFSPGSPQETIIRAMADTQAVWQDAWAGWLCIYCQAVVPRWKVADGLGDKDFVSVPTECERATAKMRHDDDCAVRLARTLVGLEATDVLPM